MAYQALYRRWRPKTFDDVIGQTHITQTLKNEIVSGRIAHAYLFCGIRGTGKTSTAKILSRAINCINNTDGNPCNECEVCRGILDGSIMDVTEIDAASNNGVDNIRDIRDEVVYSASAAKYKVYIIDEVHMLSSGAFNALLKTLEEPPPHVVFILATTEVHKLPQTILSRCQRFDFRTITSKDISDSLEKVAAADGVSITKEAVALIADMAEGAMRDALSILDRCIAFGKTEITYDDAVNILGVTDSKQNLNILKAVGEGNAKDAVNALDSAAAGAKSPVQIADGMLKAARNLLMAKLVDKPESVIDDSQSNIEAITEISGNYTKEKLINCVKVLSETINALKFSNTPKITLELAVIKLCLPEYDSSAESMADRLAALEKQVKEGIKIVPVNKETTEKNQKKEALPNKKRIKFSGEYKDKWNEILAAVKTKNPGLPGFLSKLTPAGSGDTLVLTAENEDAEKAVNFLNAAANVEKFKTVIALSVEEICGTRPRKIEYISNAEESQSYEFIEKIKGFDFIEICD